MKGVVPVVGAFALMLAFTASAAAQNPDLSVVSTQVKLAADYAADTRAARSPARITANPAANSQTETALESLGDIADTRAGKKYSLSVVVRNDGVKAISSATFEYPLNYSRSRKSSSHISFKSKRKIEPNETVTISHEFITTEHVVLRSIEGATVKRIDYVDGSVWRR